MIDNFMTGDESRDWTVKLMVDNDKSRLTPSKPVGSLVVDTSGVTGPDMHTEWSTGGAAKGTGKWTAEWYGGVTYDATTGTSSTDADIGDTIGVVGIPTAVIGTFNADIGDAARIQGAFGAMNE